jgi:DNA mismatch repair protein MutL
VSGGGKVISKFRFISNMAITALPQSTIHLLGSSQALTTTTSLVKELVDNAIDAKATSVDVLLSQNTLDKIQVRDNGRGIQQEDLDALGRRGHTSKLSTFEELGSIGGTSLGFRGEALASAVQLGEVSVTTRTDGEAVATTVTLKASGGIAKQSKTSHPIGTTICVLNFMSKLPVRKQTALKCASKTLAKTKELLQAYALARPSIRFSLKINKEAKGSWSFAPRPSDGIKEAVSQVIGKETSLQCISKIVSFSEPQQKGDNEFNVEIYLPKPDAEVSKIGHGQYLSVDSRPVSHEKGTMRKIVALYKTYLKVGLGDANEVRSPFIRIDIKCPLGSYDPNVEPAKDDVIFGNEYLVLDSFENFFKEFYGEKQVISKSTSQANPANSFDNFSLLLARKPEDHRSPIGEMPDPSHDNPPSEGPDFEAISPSTRNTDPTRQVEDSLFVPESDDAYVEAEKNRRSWGVGMSKNFDDVVPKPKGPVRDHNIPKSSAANQEEPSSSLNPWIIAKMTAPVRSDVEVSSSRLQSSPTSGMEGEHHVPDRDSATRQNRGQVFLNSPTSQYGSRMPQRAPRRRYSNEVRLDSLVPNTSQLEISRSLRHRSEDCNIYSEQRPAVTREALCNTDDTARLRPQPSGLSSSGFGVELPDFNEQHLHRRPNDFVSARSITENFPMTPSATQRRSTAKQSSRVNNPFSVPRRIGGSEPSDKLQQTTLPTFQGQLESPREQDTRSELEWAMEYEQNKEAANRTRRQQLRLARKEAEAEPSPGRARSSPHKNRYNAAIAALGGDTTTTMTDPPEPKTTLPPKDPCAYLIKHQRLKAPSDSNEAAKPARNTRLKSTKLPLEKIPEHLRTHNLVLKLSTDPDSIGKSVDVYSLHDPWISRGRSEPGLELSLAATKDLSRDVKSVVESWIQKEEGRRGCEIEWLFANLNRVQA